jgi:hypothetical protein
VHENGNSVGVMDVCVWGGGITKNSPVVERKSTRNRHQKSNAKGFKRRGKGRPSSVEKDDKGKAKFGRENSRKKGESQQHIFNKENCAEGKGGAPIFR